MEYAHNRIQPCTNCGETNHLFKNCPAPVTSYGIIAVRFPDSVYQQGSSLSSSASIYHNTSMEFLLIQRKDSLSFLEFMRGKYSHTDEDYIGLLMQNMTRAEQARLLTLSFDELWKEMWGGTSSVKSHKNNYETSERKYQMIRPCLAGYVSRYPSKWEEPEWGFPKGRRNPNESDMMCAIREFQEETGLRREDFHMIQNTGSLTETFFGSNHVQYCHKYYFAVCPSHVEVELNASNDTMTREIGGIKWCTLDEAISKIRPDNIEKQEILMKAGRIMKNFYPISIH